MISNGLKLIFHPDSPIKKIDNDSISLYLMAAAFSAATVPSIVIVIGHLASSWLGHVNEQIAIQRAAIGFVSSVLGIFVLASAFSLCLISIAKSSKLQIKSISAVNTAMAMLWPAWFCGILAGLSPILSLGPELGEYLWYISGLIFSFRVLQKQASELTGVKRRWKKKFQIKTIIFFAIFFFAIALLPSFIMRYIIGITGTITYSDIPLSQLPIPPIPNW